MKISILGSGAFGIAISVTLTANGHEIYMWSHLKEINDRLLETRENPVSLKGVKIPETVNLTDDLNDIAGSDIVIVATPSFAVNETLEKIRDVISENTVVVLLAKGLIKQDEEYLVFSELAQKVLGENHPIVALTGPAHAEEIAIGKPCCLISASNNKDAYMSVQQSFMNSNFRVYTSDDIKGAQLGGALKNIIAIASGLSSGLGFGDNATAALITRGYAEIVRLGVMLGANKDTFSGLSGMGDLIVTCMSEHSRNRRAGKLIGSGLTPTDAMEQIGAVVEGFYATKFAYELSLKLGVEMPITKAVYEVLNDGKNPQDIFEELMNRSGKSEH